MWPRPFTQATGPSPNPLGGSYFGWNWQEGKRAAGAIGGLRLIDGLLLWVSPVIFPVGPRDFALN